MEQSAPGRLAVLRSTKLALALAGLAAAAGLGLAGYVALKLKPEHDAIMLRARTTQDLFELYDLQMAHKKRYGSFAGGLEELLKTAPDGGAALRARLREHSHLDTLVVAGDQDKFKLEANVRDAERTLLRIKGPRVGDPIRR